MKRIFLLTIIAAMQFGCFAQNNSKLDSLYAYLKAKGLVKDPPFCEGYTLSNKSQEGLRKRYAIDFGLYNEGPAPTTDYMGKMLDAKADSAIRAEWHDAREAFKVICRTLSECRRELQLRVSPERTRHHYHHHRPETI